MFIAFITIRQSDLDRYIQSEPDGKAFPGSENVDKIKLANFRCKQIVKQIVEKKLNYLKNMDMVEKLKQNNLIFLNLDNHLNLV